MLLTRRLYLAPRQFRKVKRHARLGKLGGSKPSAVSGVFMIVLLIAVAISPVLFGL
jgi:hypothetical protein